MGEISAGYARSTVREKAAGVIKDEHWSFEAHKKYLDRFYTLEQIT
jgi:hypothetical protein